MAPLILESLMFSHSVITSLLFFIVVHWVSQVRADQEGKSVLSSLKKLW